jgi:hypothetical protein
VNDLRLPVASVRSLISLTLDRALPLPEIGTDDRTQGFASPTVGIERLFL